MSNDAQDDPGIVVPPPLIYLRPLVLGLLLNRKFPAPFLPRGAARILGFSLFGGGALLSGWFFRTMSRADAPIRTDKPVPRLVTDGPFRYTRNPGYLSLAMMYAGIASLANALWAGHPPLAGDAVRDPARRDRARGTLPGAQVR